MELADAVQGHAEQEQDKLQWQLWGYRKIAWWASRAHFKDLKEEDIYTLDIDKEIKKQRHKRMPKIKVTKLK